MASMEQANPSLEPTDTSCADISALGPGGGRGEQCTARSKRTGERCRAAAVTGRSVCYHHGGATPRGIAHPKYTGRRPPIPGPIGEAYERASADPQLLEATPDIAILDARVQELWARQASGEREGLWDLLTDAVQDAQQAQTKGTLDVSALLTTLSDLCTRARERESVWRALDAAVHSRAKLVDAEMRRQVAAQETASKAEVGHLMNQIALAIRSRVLTTLPDAQLQRQLLTDLQADLTALGTNHPAVARAPVSDAAPAPD